MNDRGYLRATFLVLSFFILVLLAAWISINSRSFGGFAIFWAPNALLLGIWLRFPRTVAIYSVLGAAMGYLAADIFVKTDLIVTATFACGNILSVGSGYLLLNRLSEGDRKLLGLTSVLKLFLVTLVASAAGGLFGGLAVISFFSLPFFAGWSRWFVTDVVNYLTILPALLTLPANFKPSVWLNTPADDKSTPHRQVKVAPVGFLIAMSAAAFVIGGPGAVAVPLPALLWCAVLYRPFTVACLTFAYGIVSQLGIATGVFLPKPEDFAQESLQLSLHLGIAFIAVCPNILAAVMTSRNALLEEFKRLASQDSLCDLMNRRAFFEEASVLLEDAKTNAEALSLLIIDIDNFKSINDSHGHQVGDEVIRRTAAVLKGRIRQGDILARIGGEEFAILAPGLPQTALADYAERLRRACENTVIRKNGRSISITISIGAVFTPHSDAGIDVMILHADEALYRAKDAGRNRVELHAASRLQDS
ncbi:diguanylate cyclase [Martelella lutilitoris]|uniref:diguanylate cyclase n=1 Tax=Martelella lutilitoris TaxID=2583532 RepID=A0A5C4JLW1_9HYPH|nr:GGDEF domain-containing protein [Martelella lutilitoris]TNB46280.1 diguanylate cyclase [Martelella lutilitoris]